MSKGARLTFRSNVKKKSHREAARIANRGIGKHFPNKFRDIFIKRNVKTSSHAYTTSTGTPGRLQISFNPRKHKSHNKDRRFAKLVQTFAHEMFAHALPDQIAASQGLAKASMDDDHRRMHDPTHRGAFLNAHRRTFNELANSQQKTAFAESFAKDVINETRGLGLTSTQKNERRTWARARRDSMIDAIQNPQAHPWAT